LFVRRHLGRLLGPPSVAAPSGWGAGDEPTQEEIRALKVLIERQQAQISDLRKELQSVRDALNRMARPEQGADRGTGAGRAVDDGGGTDSAAAS